MERLRDYASPEPSRPVQPTEAERAVRPVLHGRRPGVPLRPVAATEGFPARRPGTVQDQPATTTENGWNLDPNSFAHTFKDMFDSKYGTFRERLRNWWIKPKLRPESTIKILDAIGIGKIPAIAKKEVKDVHGAEELRKKSNYSLQGTNLEDLVHFATKTLWFNEKGHIRGFLEGTVLGGLAVGLIMSGLQVPLGIAIVVAILGGVGISLREAALVLAQWYTRARMALVIDKKIAQGKPFNASEYPNTMGLKTPATTITISPDNELLTK